MQRRILIACDKFKGSLSSSEVCDALSTGLMEIDPELTCIPFPLADGGEGTTEILVHHTGGRIVETEVHDPLMRAMTGYYGISGDENTAFIEMSVASGLHLLKSEERRAASTTTFGTGELMRDGLDRGVTNFFIGIGGSATNDGATGAAAALGYEFFGGDGKSFIPVGESLSKITTIETQNVHPALKKSRVTALCDVDNPFSGKNGAAWIYGFQKGATQDEVELLDNGLVHLEKKIFEQLGVDMAHLPGAGGGGGFGGGCVAFFGAKLKRGIATVFEISGFKDIIKSVDVVITGEGKMDSQTLRGKVVSGVSALARQYEKPLYGITGVDQLSTNDRQDLGFRSVWQLTDVAPLSECLARGDRFLKREIATKLYEDIKKMKAS